MILALRVAFVGVIAAALLTLRELWLLPGGPAHSGLRLVASLGVVLVALTAVMLTVAPTAWFLRAAASLRQADEWLAKPHLEDWTREGVCLAALGVITFIAMAILEVPRQRSVDSNDQSAYLALADDIRESGGPLAILNQLYRGQWREANRHPLYPMLLSFVPTFAQGKWLSAGIGLLCLGSVTVLAARRFGWLVAGSAACLLSVNMAFCHSATLVTCEALLTWLSCLAWLSLLATRSASDAANSDSGKRPAGYWPYLAAGAAIGLTQLTKGTGVLLFGGMLLWLAWLAWRRWIGRREAVLVVAVASASFLLTTSPLIARNCQRFGSPFFNVNSYLLFADKFIPPEQLAEQKTVADAAHEYLRTHSFVDMARREATGLIWEGFIFLRMFGPTPLDDSRVFIGLPLVALALLGLRARHPSESTLLLCWTMPLILLFAWYIPIVASERFLLLILFPWLCYAAAGLVQIWQRVTRDWAPNSSRTGLVICGAVWCASWCALTWQLGLPS